MTEAERRTQFNRYLLGLASREERDEIEDRYLQDDELFEELVGAENDLIDDYVHGKLHAHENRQFEAQFLSPLERRERIEFARSLVRSGGDFIATEDACAAKRIAWQSLVVRVAVATVLLALVAALAWMAMVNRELRDQLQVAQTGRTNAERQSQELQRRVADLGWTASAVQTQQVGPLPVPGSATLFLSLVPDLTRGRSQQITLQLSHSISQVFLLITREKDESMSYDVVLETAEGNQIWHKTDLQGQWKGYQDKVIAVEIPLKMLMRGDYVLRLFRAATGATSQELASYGFRVLRP